MAAAKVAEPSTLCRFCASMAWESHVITTKHGVKGIEIRSCRPSSEVPTFRERFARAKLCDVCSLICDFVQRATVSTEQLSDHAVELVSFSGNQEGTMQEIGKLVDSRFQAMKLDNPEDGVRPRFNRTFGRVFGLDGLRVVIKGRGEEMILQGSSSLRRFLPLVTVPGELCNPP